MTVIQTLWAIRHKPTGHFLPKPEGRMGRGGSFGEPTPGCEPRIFRLEKSARSALTAWLRGRFECSRGYHSGGPDWIDESYEETTVVPQAHRKREDMEIVTLKLIMGEQ